MRRVNWQSVEKQTKDLKRKIKNVKSAASYLENKPEKGYFIDNMANNKLVEISKCKSSTLRRFLKSLDKYYYLVSSQVDKDFILEKKIEIETELNARHEDE